MEIEKNKKPYGGFYIPSKKLKDKNFLNSIKADYIETFEDMNVKKYIDYIREEEPEDEGCKLIEEYKNEKVKCYVYNKGITSQSRKITYSLSQKLYNERKIDNVYRTQKEDCTLMLLKECILFINTVDLINSKVKVLTEIDYKDIRNMSVQAYASEEYGIRIDLAYDYIEIYCGKEENGYAIISIIGDLKNNKKLDIITNEETIEEQRIKKTLERTGLTREQYEAQRKAFE